ncbi:MAG: thermonuclease family protein [Methylotenera sp.]|nr:thermonuclease family protein [Methylotenera sp.]MDP3061127.1 thermonuclease family protein [Methylotenera sp.]
MIKHKIQIILLAFTLTFSLAAHAETIEGRVVGVSDGDTLTILDADNAQFKIRLAAIDAPEKAQAFGQRGKEKLSDICYGKHASVTVVDTDRYGRTVGEVVCDGTNANETMIKSGLAWVYRKYAKGYGHLYAFEEEAKAAKRGLWADPNPTAPWEWRKAKRNH